MKRIIIALLIILIGGAVFAHYHYQHNLFYHFKPVVPGKLYRSGTLSKDGLNAVYAKTHIKTIVILRSKNDIKRNKGHWFTTESTFAKNHGIHLVILNIKPDTPPTKTQMKTFLSVTQNPDLQPVLVHCEYGVIRTGMMIALYRAKVLGQSPAYILKHMTFWGHRMKRHHEAINFIQGLKPTVKNQITSS